MLLAHRKFKYKINTYFLSKNTVFLFKLEFKLKLNLVNTDIYYEN